MDLSSHHATGAALETLGHLPVTDGRNADEAIKVVGSRGDGRSRDLLVRQRYVLLIEPEPMIVPGEPEQIDDDWVDKPAQGEDSNQLIRCQQLLE